LFREKTTSLQLTIQKVELENSGRRRNIARADASDMGSADKRATELTIIDEAGITHPFLHDVQHHLSVELEDEPPMLSGPAANFKNVLISLKGPE
jgi:hypothetical protein